MAFIIPNSTDTSGGEEYNSLDQAEPDSLDFEIIGTVGINGVLSGCGVTANGNLTVNVAAGTIVVGGKSYAVSANATLGLPTSPADNRFDLVVARVSAGTASLVVVQGVESASNPVYPQSMSVYGGAYDGSIHVDFDTDVVLAALLRVGGASITSKEIVDKRVMVTSSVLWQGTSLPASADNGTLFFLTNEVTTGVGVFASGLYVRANGAWLSMAANNAYTSGVPVGSTVWFNGTSVPAGYLLEDGSGYSTTTYASLFAVIGYTYGGSGGTFNVPNTVNRFVRGSVGANVGVTGGSDTTTLVTANLPSHDHSLNNHQHTMTHDHNMNHGHTASSGTAGSHIHTGSSQLMAAEYMVIRLTSYLSGNYLTGVNNNTAPYSRVYNSDGSYYEGGMGVSTYGPNPTFALNVNANGDHSHTITVNSFSGNTGGASNSTTSQATGNTGLTGTGTSFTNMPAYVQKLPCIKAL